MNKGILIVFIFYFFPAFPVLRAEVFLLKKEITISNEHVYLQFSPFEFPNYVFNENSTENNGQVIRSEGYLLKKHLENQDKKQAKNVLQLNLIPLAFTSFNLFYERKAFSNASFVMGFNYYLSKRNFFKYYNSKWFSTTIDFRWYFSKQELSGLYISPYLKYRYIIDFDIVNYLPDPSGASSIETPVQDEHWHYAGMGITTGYQKVFNTGFTLGFLLGGGYYPIVVLRTINPEYTINKGLRTELRAGLTAGFAF
ncbi:MAG: DUF3575 domain-containing protein [Bacteroidetes bacterium]|nr:DUF3575 domain-containing protein [Bacteroidota bacterium]HET6245150.1 DUF3575 domain-containing protein [Bacteroidia bacterium]